MPDYRSLRIVFMGTPDFAVASLDALVRAECQVVGVVTAPDKPAGRGMRMQESPVKRYALAHHLNLLQPEKLKDPAFLNGLRALRADLQVVVAFRMLPEVVWNMPPMGSINLHGSLLPQYRGAAPINWAVINGETETGVTTFKLKHEIDTGDILMQERFPIGEDDTAGDVHDHMMLVGAQVLVDTVKGLAEGTLKEKPQSSQADIHSPVTTHHSPLHHAPKIFTDTCRIDFHRTVREVHNLVRGLSPFPGAFTQLNGKTLKIYRTKKEENKPGHDPGQFDTDGKSYLKFACLDGYVSVLDLQLEGKKKMPVKEFLKGYRFE